MGPREGGMSNCMTNRASVGIYNVNTHNETIATAENNLVVFHGKKPILRKAIYTRCNCRLLVQWNLLYPDPATLIKDPTFPINYFPFKKTL